MQHVKASMIIKRARQKNLDPSILLKGAWVSTMLALFIVLPLVATLFAVYSITDSIILAAIACFAVHIVTLASIGRVSDYLTEMLN
jgi:hypothetical protein